MTESKITKQKKQAASKGRKGGKRKREDNENLKGKTNTKRAKKDAEATAECNINKGISNSSIL